MDRSTPNRPGVSSANPVEDSIDHLFRHQAGQMVAILVRIFGLAHLSLAEDVVQEAFIKALKIWPFEGAPDHPKAWLLKVARNRALDVLRRQDNWREKAAELGSTLDALSRESFEADSHFLKELQDDQLRLIFACCHPKIHRNAQVALTLKTAGGFGVSEIARAFLAKPSTIAQRLVRAKRQLRESEVDLAFPSPAQLPARRESVLEALYLMFNEGYSALEGEDLVREDLCHEALRIALLLADHPTAGAPEVDAAAALFAFQSARLGTRTDHAGDLMLLSQQDRQRWDPSLIRLAIRRLGKAARGDRITTYHLEARIACHHALAPDYEATDWPAILESYDGLMNLNPSPVVALNRAVALGKVEGPAAALEAAESLREEPALRDYYPLHATLGQLYLQLDRSREAEHHFERALELTASEPVRRFLLQRLGG